MSIKVIDNFITEPEEKDLLFRIPHSKVTLGHNRNRIIRYGSKLPYMAPTQPIPIYLQSLCYRLVHLGYLQEKPDSVSINEYHANQSIDWHIDSPSSGPIISVLSIQSDAEMGLRKKGQKEVTIYPLKARSLLLLDGDERTLYEHCIYPVKVARFSIVFRKGTKI